MASIPKDLKGVFLAVVVGGTLVFGVLSVLLHSVDAFEGFYDFSRRHEDWELDEWVLIGVAFLVTASLCGTVLSLSLVSHLRRQIARAAVAVAEAERQAGLARRAEMARSRFLSNMSHELRTPLNAIGGFSELLAIDLPDLTRDPGVLGYVTHIQGACSALTALVEDVLTLTDLETSRAGPAAEEIDLAGVVDDLGEEIAPLLAERGNRLVADGLGRIRRGRVPLERVLRNLVVELAQECRDGEIRVHQDRADGSRGVVLTVAAPHLRWSETRLAEVLGTQLPEGGIRPRIGPGTGLGVSLARGFLGILGGSLDALVEPGLGSGFRVILPALDESATPRPTG
jgi:signal transduction histidine kinase